MNYIAKSILVIKTIANFPIGFLDKLGFLNGLIIYRIRNTKAQLIARSHTEDIAEIVVVVSGYEYPLNILPKLNKPYIFDIGGYIGDFTVYAHSFYKGNCRIFTFEPDSENYKFCKLNFILNDLDISTCYNLAVSIKNGNKYLNRDKRNHDAYSLSEKKTGNSPRCEIMSFDNIAKLTKIKKVDILKMDIEGEEYNIFMDKKSLNWILKNTHYIFMEYHEIDHQFNYSLIKGVIEKNFRILSHKNNVLSLENLSW